MVGDCSALSRSSMLKKGILVALMTLMLAAVVTLFRAMKHILLSEAKSVVERGSRGLDEFLIVLVLVYFLIINSFTSIHSVSYSLIYFSF